MTSPPRYHASTPFFISVLVLLCIAALLYSLLRPHRTPTHPQLTTRPTTIPTASTPQPTPYTPKLLFDVLKHDHPQFATTQPLELPLDLRDAAHYTLAGPLYFDPNRLDLWLTRPTAPPAPAVLRTALDDQTHVLRDRVLYVHWQPDPDTGTWLPHPILSTPAGPQLLTPTGQPLPLPPHPYDFSHPLSYNNLLALPTPTGVVILRIQNNQITEYPHTLPGLSTQHSALSTQHSDIQLLLDSRGLLAFLPSTNQSQGSTGLSRFVDDHWTDLTPSSGFPQKILHLLPLLDGSAIAICPTTPHHIDLQLLTLDPAPPVDLPAVQKLVASLSDPTPQTRQSAYDQLTRYGPSVFPTLQKLLPDQPPEARIRLTQLLRSQLHPTLGPFTLLDDQLDLVSRTPDGSALFYAPAGVSLPTPNDTPATVSPAWLSLRPGQPVRLLPDSLTRDLNPRTAQLIPFQSEWILLDPTTGPSRFIGNSLVPLLHPNERRFSQFLGIDRRGRWLFQDPSSSGVVASATTSPSTTQSSVLSTQHSAFLLIDPTLPDPTPRLPAWTLDIENATVGWDQHDYPALRAGSAFALTATDWRPLDPKSDTFSNTPPSSPSTPTTSPTSAPSTQHSALPLLTTPDGTRYYDARTQLIAISKTNHRTTWPLPPEHQATLDPILIYADSHLFLFNQPGKCLRLTPTPDQPQPFSIDATFTENIPNTDHPLRIWLDPAGRICFAADPTHLTLLFPTGRIPPEIAQKMPSDQLK